MLQYDWEITDTPKICACGVKFSVDHAMVCQCGGFIIQRHIELRDLEAEMTDLHSSTFGCVTLTQTLTESWLISRSTKSMRKGRRGSMRKELWKSNRERSLP